MKRILIILLSLVTLTLSAQTVPDNELSRSIREFPQRAGNNLHSFEFLPLHDTPAPKGYKPFYISHYGRHGSRTSSEGKIYDRVEKALSKALADGMLTPDGEVLLDATRRVVKGYDGMSGRLTPRGRREHAAIAERMYHRYSSVFKKGSKKIFAASSTVPRCIISMTAFTNRLMMLQRDLDIDIDTGENFMKYISQADTKELRESTAPVLDALYKDFIPDTTVILQTLFKNPASARQYLYSNSSYRLEKDIFRIAQATEALDVEENLFRLLPEDAVYYWAERYSMYIYLHHANSALNGDVRIPRASLLMDDIITRADEVIAGAPRAADLRFGHDWPFVSLACYLGLEGISRRMTTEEARGNWPAALYTPLAANLQMIFYRNKHQDILVKFLLNEKETLISGLAPVQGPYYRWEDVKHYVREEWN